MGPILYRPSTLGLDGPDSVAHWLHRRLLPEGLAGSACGFDRVASSTGHHRVRLGVRLRGSSGARRWCECGGGISGRSQRPGNYEATSEQDQLISGGTGSARSRTARTSTRYVPVSWARAEHCRAGDRSRLNYLEAGLGPIRIAGSRASAAPPAVASSTTMFVRERTKRELLWWQ